MKFNKSIFVAQSGIIAALYVTLTWVSSLIGLSYGNIQLRLSEVLTILPVFTPAAIPGLTIGCFIANLGSPYGILDMLLGSLATLIASTLCYKLRKKQICDLPVLSALMPVWTNALSISLVISPFFSEIASDGFWIFIITGLQVGLGEFITATVLGLLLYKTLKKNGLDKVIM